MRTPSADIADLLRWHAGLDIGRTGGAGQPASVFIRGTNSNHTAVLINGIKMNSATTGTPALEMIRPASVERIEVIKGPRSTVYGSEAIGGVINVITQTNNVPRPSGNLYLSGGRYATHEQGIGIKYHNDRLSGNIAFNRFDSRGFPAKETSNTDHGHNNDSINVNVNTKVGKTQLRLDYWLTEGHTEYDNFGIDADQDRKNAVFNATLSVPVTDHWQSALSISRTKDEGHQNQNNDFAITDRYIYDWKNDVSLIGNVLTLGASVTDEDAESLSFGTNYKENTHTYSIYLHNQSNKNRHSLFTSTRHTKHEDFDNATTWNFEYGYALTNDAGLFASIGTGFRSPDSNARFGFGGNPNLREETSRTIEIGINYSLNENTRLSMRAFESRIEDLIETIEINPGANIYENKNINNARIQGIDLAFQHSHNQWHLSLEGILQNPRNETNGSPLLRRAKRSMTGSLEYEHENFFILLNGLLTSERRDSGGVELSGYGLFNLSAGYKFPGSVLSLKVDNIFDKDYQLASGYNTPGRSVFAELRINFAR